MRALVVEDSTTCARVAMRALSSNGFAVERYGSAKGARSALHGRLFDFAIVDANIPEVDLSDVAHAAGLDVAKAIRSAFTSCKIIVWSGDPIVEQSARDLGFDFILKGDPAKLDAVIVTAMNSK